MTLDSKHDANPKASNLEEDIVQERRYQHQDDMVLVDVRHGFGSKILQRATKNTHRRAGPIDLLRTLRKIHGQYDGSPNVR